MKRVSLERWQEAQRWERSVWLGEHQQGPRAALARVLGRVLPSLSRLSQGDDWNEWWGERFEGYSFLPRTLGDLIELGCGPYTNARVITRGRKVRRIVCSDPLIRDYLALKGTWLYRAYIRGEVLVDDHPVEETPFPGESFDVVILINVLDHVFDADLALMNAARIVRLGGFLLIGQDLSNDQDVARYPHDIGHPIRLQSSDIYPHVKAFDPVLNRVFERDQGRNPDAHYGTLIYAGVKKAVD